MRRIDCCLTLQCVTLFNVQCVRLFSVMKVTYISDISQPNQYHTPHLYSNDMWRRERSKEEDLKIPKGHSETTTGYDHIQYVMIRYKRYDLYDQSDYSQ